MSKEGEVERKVRELGDEVFSTYDPNRNNIQDGEQFITKDNLRDFIKKIMEAAGEDDAWDEDDFENGYYQFDKDRSGQIDRQEFDDFVKRFADLWTGKTTSRSKN